MKLRKRSTALLAAAFASMMLMSGCGQAKIGYIDGERVSKEAPQISALVEEGNQKLNEAREQSQAEIQQKMKENPNMSQEEAQKLQMDTQRKLQGLNQSYALQLRQKVDAALAKVTKNKKLDAVVNNSQEQPIAISGATDVTDDVIKELQ